MGDDFTIAKLIKRFADGAVQVGDVAGWTPDILNCSFGAPTPDDEPPQAMTAEIAALQALGCVVVASAGNDATCRPSWPAALPDVISVAALGPEGPAPFTNFGPWVRASAPGVDVVSRFFHFEGDESTATDLQKAIGEYGEGYATWSGTSFSAPIVAGVLAAAVRAGRHLAQGRGAPVPRRPDDPPAARARHDRERRAVAGSVRLIAACSIAHLRCRGYARRRHGTRNDPGPGGEARRTT